MNMSSKEQDLSGLIRDFKKYTANNNLEQVYIRGTGNNFTITMNGVDTKYTWHHHEDGKSLIPYLKQFIQNFPILEERDY